DDHLRELVTFLRVDRELELAFLELVLRRNWRSLARTGLEAALHRHLRVLQRLGELRVLLVVVPLLRPYQGRLAEPHYRQCDSENTSSHIAPPWLSHNR